jgi:hypothetical protein
MSISALRRWRRGVRQALAYAAVALVLVLVLVPAAAQAQYYLGTHQANAMAADFVASHYANTYVKDLSTSCRPQNARRAVAGFIYHRWTCRWWDSSDGTSGRVLILGSRGAGNYYGTVLNGARG